VAMAFALTGLALYRDEGRQEVGPSGTMG
jgi:hypothetical protein